MAEMVIPCDRPDCSLIRKGRILSAVRTIHSTLDLDSILKSFLELSVGEIGVEGGTIYFADQAKGLLESRHIVSSVPVERIVLKMGEGIAGTVALTGEPILTDDTTRSTEFIPKIDGRSGYRTRNAICFPLKDEKGVVIGVLQLVNKRGGGFSGEDTAFLEDISTFTALAIKNAQHLRDSVEKARMQREINLAREIQARILPRDGLVVPGHEAWAAMEPCYETAGDYYQVFPMGASTLVVVADVSGKGLASAMVASGIHSYLCATVGKTPSIAALAAELSEFLWNTYECEKYATAVLLEVAPGGALSFVNAGHTPLLHIRPQGAQAHLTTGMPLGMLPGTRFECRSLELAAGECLAIYSDGYTEANDENEEEFGVDRLGRALAAAHALPLDRMAGELGASLKSFQGTRGMSDDRTLFLLRKA